MSIIILFRPFQLPKHGFLYGWYISKHTICIAGAITASSRERAADSLVKALADYHVSLDGQEDAEPEILGYLGEGNKAILERALHSDFITIFYNPPNTKRMQFFSLNPLKLDITQESTLTPNIASTTATERIRLLHEFDMSNKLHNRSPTPLSVSLRYLNKVDELCRTVAARQGSRPLLPHWISSACYCTELPVITLNKICSVTSSIFHPFPPPFPFVGNKRLKDASAFVQQLDVRKDLLLFLLEQFWTVEKRDKNDLHFTSVQYISLYNSIWLILNDIIVGVAFGVFLIENRQALSLLLYEVIKRVTVIYMRSILIWLDNWPAGLKLNTELSRALFHSFILVIDAWEVMLEGLAPYFPMLLRFTGIMGRFGFTISISLFSDYLSILTGHLYILHLVTASVFSKLKSFSGSLWNLFRGKRFNVLRQRNDFWEYDLDQLLLGTILFTLITFLFPTVALYYLLFALSRFGIMLLHAALDTCLAFMNHFPLFALMLRIKEPSRLPGGIQFKVGAANFLVIQNQPIPLSKIFFQHLTVWSRLSSHYHPLRLLACIITGAPMTQIARQNIRYDLVHRKTSVGTKTE